MKSLGTVCLGGNPVTLMELTKEESKKNNQDLYDDEDQEYSSGLAVPTRNIAYVVRDTESLAAWQNTVIHELVHIALYHSGSSIEWDDELAVRCISSTMQQILSSDKVLTQLGLQRIKGK